MCHYLVIEVLFMWFFSQSSSMYSVMHITEARATPTCIYAADIQCLLLKHSGLPWQC